MRGRMGVIRHNRARPLARGDNRRRSAEEHGDGQPDGPEKRPHRLSIPSHQRLNLSSIDRRGAQPAANERTDLRHIEHRRQIDQHVNRGRHHAADDRRCNRFHDV